MVFGSVAVSFRCAFLRGIECFVLRKSISGFAEATREKRFTTITPLAISRDVKCLCAYYLRNVFLSRRRMLLANFNVKFGE